MIDCAGAHPRAISLQSTKWPQVYMPEVYIYLSGHRYIFRIYVPLPAHLKIHVSMVINQLLLYKSGCITAALAERQLRACSVRAGVQPTQALD